LESPVTVQAPLGPKTVQVNAPGEEVTVYFVGVPPPLAGITVTVACPLPATAEGAPGVLGGSIVTVTVGDAADVPPPLVAVLVKV
jgi:hypothetical protein